MCRTHAIQASLDGQEIDLDESSPLFGILDAADRILSRTNNETLRQMGTVFGEMLSAKANQRRVPPGQHRPPPPPPRQVVPEEDPRTILGFEPNAPLTAEIIKERKKALATIYHPDRPGGSVTAMKRVNQAADKLLCSL